MGGLGNQMFQYAAGRALSLSLGVPFKLDLSWFDDMQGATPRRFMLNAFPIAAAEATPVEIERTAYRKHNFVQKILRRRKRSGPYNIVEPSFNYWPGFTTLIAPAYLKGYWQQEQYFAAAADIIRQDFLFPPFACAEAIELADQIKSSPSAVAVHIRRGDYIEDKAICKVHGICSPAYYEKALQTLAVQLDSPLRLFLFTDDPAWVRTNFEAQGYPLTVIDIPEHQDNPWHDMHLMSLCQHHIIANSSFSWWGAWLSGKHGQVCAPRRWFAEEAKKDDTPVPAAWMRL